MSFITCLIITSLILSYCLYTLGWPHLTSAHDLCPLVTAKYYRWPLPIPSEWLMPTPQRSSAQKERNRVSWYLLLISHSISCHSSHVASLRHCAWPQRDKKRVKQRVYQRVQKRELTESIGSESVSHMSLITCHSSHVIHHMSHHYVIDTKLMPIYSWMATFNLWPWPLSAGHRIFLLGTSALPFPSNLCPPRSVLLPRRIRE